MSYNTPAISIKFVENAECGCCGHFGQCIVIETGPEDFQAGLCCIGDELDGARIDESQPGLARLTTSVTRRLNHEIQSFIRMTETKPARTVLGRDVYTQFEMDCMARGSNPAKYRGLRVHRTARTGIVAVF